MTPTGFAHQEEMAGKQQALLEGDAPSDATPVDRLITPSDNLTRAIASDKRIKQIVDAWPALSDEVRASIVHLIESENSQGQS
jgi:hypothetical protein